MNVDSITDGKTAFRIDTMATQGVIDALRYGNHSLAVLVHHADQPRFQNRIDTAVLNHRNVKAACCQITFHIGAGLVIHIERVEVTQLQQRIDFAGIRHNSPARINLVDNTLLKLFVEKQQRAHGFFNKFCPAWLFDLRNKKDRNGQRIQRGLNRFVVTTAVVVVEAAGDIKFLTIDTFQQLQHTVGAAAPLSAVIQQQDFLFIYRHPYHCFRTARYCPTLDYSNFCV